MDWKKESTQKLLAYTSKLNATLTLPDEIKRLESRYTSIRSARTDATPVSGGGSTREDDLLTNIVKRGELERRLREEKLWIATVDKALSVLGSDDRKILDMLLIHPQKGAISRVCDEFNLEDESSVYRRRTRALRKFTLAYYGATETL